MKNYVAFADGDPSFFDDSLAVERDVALVAAKRWRGSVWRRPSWDPQWRNIPPLVGGPLEYPSTAPLEKPPMAPTDEPQAEPVPVHEPEEPATAAPTRLAFRVFLTGASVMGSAVATGEPESQDAWTIVSMVDERARLFETEAAARDWIDRRLKFQAARGRPLHRPMIIPCRTGLVGPELTARAMEA